MVNQPAKRGRPAKVKTAPAVEATTEKATPAKEALASVDAKVFQFAVEDFQSKFPEHWERLRLCPLQHGVDEMARIIKAGK